MAKCRECGIGKLNILGTSGFGDTIEVECQNPECNEIYEVEPDGLGMGGLEFVDAQIMDMDIDDDIDDDDYDD
jgi:ssDNA-binding Zn-finger/Zn-ribbon topoisomerase 1